MPIRIEGGVAAMEDSFPQEEGWVRRGGRSGICTRGHPGSRLGGDYKLASGGCQQNLSTFPKSSLACAKRSVGRRGWARDERGGVGPAPPAPLLTRAAWSRR